MTDSTAGSSAGGDPPGRALTDPPDPVSAGAEPATESGEVSAYFELLGTTIERRWRSVGGRHDQLPDIAAEVLGVYEPPPGLDAHALLRHVASAASLPRQRPLGDAFGQPPAVFYLGDGFEVQALVWMEGSTSIHQHGFDGAFRVLCGSSLHVPYVFDPAGSLADDHMQVGELRVRSPEVLRPGDTRPIVSGPGFIHALYHLERPSVTIVARNTWSNLPFPQYDYRPPGLAVDALYRDDDFGIRMRALYSLSRLDPDAAARAALDVVRGHDLWSAYRVAEHWLNNFGAGPRFDDLATALAERHRALGEVLGPVFAEQSRRSRLLARRGMLTETRHRTFLALLLNLPDRESISHMMRQLFPGEDPDVLTVALVEELAAPGMRSVSGLRLSAEDRAQLQTRLSQGRTTDALSLVSDQWRPPSLLENLFA